jgi:hypothetical protein
MTEEAPKTTNVRAVNFAAYRRGVAPYHNGALEAHVYVDGYLRLRVPCEMHPEDTTAEVPPIFLECMKWSRVTLRFADAETGDERSAPIDPNFEDMRLPEGDSLTWPEVMLHNRAGYITGAVMTADAHGALMARRAGAGVSDV